MLLFLDFETTHNDLSLLRPLEVALVAVTDDLQREISRRHYVFAMPPDALVPAVVVAMHAKSGLWGRCQETALRPADLDPELARWLDVARDGDVVHLAGNSVWFDREVLRQFLPLTHACLHHRQVDLSSLNELARVHAPDLHKGRPQPKGIHLAMPDALESLELARYYARALAAGHQVGQALADHDARRGA